MPKKKKRFIEKGKGVKFALVRREPDEEERQNATAPTEYTLEEVKAPSSHQSRHVGWDGPEKLLPTGEYDYSQHLRTIGAGVFIPREDLQEHEELLALARARAKKPMPLPAVPVEKVEEEQKKLVAPVDARAVRELLKTDLKEEGPLEEMPDNFMALLQGEGDQDVEGEMKEEEEEEEEEIEDFEMFDEDQPIVGEVRDEFLEAHFAALVEQYGDEQMGELEGYDLQGTEELNPEAHELKSFLDRRQAEYALGRDEAGEADLKALSTAKQHILAAQERPEVILSLEEMFPNKPVPKWDVESILTTHTDTENRPFVVREPRRGVRPVIVLNEQTGLPQRPRRALPMVEESEESDAVEMDEEVPARRRDETAEQKKERKRKTKAARQKRRAIKKANKKNFTRFEKAAKKSALHAQHGAGKKL